MLCQHCDVLADVVAAARATSARNAAVTPGATFAWSAGSAKNRPIALKVAADKLETGRPAE
jgi:hypothetical protein